MFALMIHDIFLGCDIFSFSNYSFFEFWWAPIVLHCRSNYLFYWPNTYKPNANTQCCNIWLLVAWDFSFSAVLVWVVISSNEYVRLGLACCTATFKRWSEAMDFFQTIFKTNISLSGIFENYIIKG